MPLIGQRQLTARLKAMERVPRPLGQEWQKRTIPRYRAAVPVRTGKTRGSFRPGRATDSFAEVKGSFVAIFIDKGTKAHDIPKKRGKRSKRAAAHMLRFQEGGDTIFARRVHHRGTRAHPFREKGAAEGLRDAKFANIVTGLWNSGA